MSEIDREALALLPFELRAEIAENLYRKDWTPSEMDAVRRSCNEVLAREAKNRQATAGPTNGRGAKTGPRKLSLTAPGKTTDKVGALFGKSGRTIEKIAKVVEAAKAEPERFGKVLEDMDRTGRVDGPYKRLKAIKQAEAIRKEPAPLPGNGPYRVIVADPPWTYEKRCGDPSQRGAIPYPSMSVEAICAMDVKSIAHDDCILWLWTTNAHMREAFSVLDAWGFEHKTILTWVKDRMGTGDWLRGQTEHCLMAVRGKPIVTLTNQTTVLHAPVRGHSVKPREFYELVESLCPAPRYAELFSRQSRPGWDGHGDEVAA
jgi:N6-adenosine-specific RNA methylase IME4